MLVDREPESFGTEADGVGCIGLGERVAASIDRAVELVESVALQLLQQGTRLDGNASAAVATEASHDVTWRQP